MEGLGNHRIRARIAFVLAGIVLMGGLPARGEENSDESIVGKANRTSVVYTTPDAAVVDIEVKASSPTAPKTAPAKPKRSCRLEPINVDPIGPNNPNNLGLPHPPDQLPYWLVCDGEEVGIVWRKINPGARGASPPRPRDVALNARDEIPMPPVTVRVSPQSSGMVGTESWFWIEGYDGGPIAHTTTAFGVVVEVQARVTRYRWSFGDGTTVESKTLGRAYPERSEIRHVYQRSSSGFPAGFPVDVEFVFAVSYRVDGGPWIDLPGISRFARLDYLVRESQAVIVR